MKKRIFSTLILVLLATSLLVACGPAKPDLSGTITIWHSLKDVEIEALNNVITAYQVDQPNVQFELLFVPDDDLRGKFETAAAVGEGPDILIGSDDWGPAMYDALLVADVSSLGSKVFNKIHAGALAEGSYKDVQVGIPYNLKGVIMYRNSDIIADAASSFDDLVTKAEAATSGDTYGALLEIGAFFSYGHLYGLGGSLMDAGGNPTFNTPEGEAWLEMLVTFAELGAEPWYTDNEVTLFKEGKAGIIIDGTWNLDPILQEIGDSLVIDPWPKGMSGFVQSKYVFLNANTSGAAADAALDFMAHMVSVDAQTSFAETDPGFLPVTDGVEVADSLRQQALTAMAGGVAFPVIPEMGVYWGPMETAIRTVVDEGTDPAVSLQTAYDSVVAALDEMHAGQ
ncbi:MAG: extracellular solute-binding protein [Anaerolineae bacterium]|nr:extracellular solute-binding protein [Anaerolineae bacterium]